MIIILKSLTNIMNISNLFNYYFTSAGSKINAEISNTDIKFDIPSMLNTRRSLNVTNQLNTSKASGTENISSKFYRLIAPIISTYFSEIFKNAMKREFFLQY